MECCLYGHYFRAHSVVLDKQLWDSSLGKTSSPSLSSHQWPVALNLGARCIVIPPSHVSMSVGIVIGQVLFRQPL